VTLHYHALPITPNSELYTLAGRNFLVSHGTSAKAQMRIADEIGQQVLADNGAFTRYRKLLKWIAEQRASGVTVTADEEFELLHKPVDWKPFYEWVEPWLNRPTTHAIIPDVIDASSQEQDALLNEWPFGDKGWPVFHIHHHEDRLYRLLDTWPVVCLGSAGEFWEILSEPWTRRMDRLWNGILQRHPRTPKLHMLRGMQLCVSGPYPFYSVDSSDVGQNHARPQNTARAMADRWDAAQCPPVWKGREPHPDLFEERAA
jgi:hypothetical protein